ncbi:amino acid ABC transporter substrate-binding protein [Halobellus sp. Atlit-38R]|uniref:ABC transporter substrate-binding protein n=1 Tax=Halobellus sp. Atlit-38R TaxID=2282131 RepID=UPI000EF178A0|nr:ABC transporter substrate-binding protein [Halobellus sp. Atlit-38R]RLM88669.1 amino acid ABC transporter substrate-binding protein [Halobellus sp. Atlit-38R]
MSRKTFDRRAILKATGGAATIGLLAGCSSNGGDNGGGGTETDDSGGGGTTTTTSGGSGDSDAINIGSVQPLSGGFTPWGQAHSAGLAFAVQEINADGGVLGGRNLNIVEANSESDPAEASSIFERFAEQNDIVAATGPVSSDVGIRTSRTAQELGIPMIMHMAGSDETITPETLHSFRLGLLPAATTMQAQAQFVDDAGYQSVGAIVGDYAWGQSVKTGIEENFGIDVNVQVAPVGASDFSSYIRRMPQDVEMVVATGHPPGSLTITQQLYELGYEPEIITGPGLPPAVIRSALGENASRGFTHLHMSDVYTDEYAEVAQRFGEEVGSQFDTHTSYGYVTGKMIAQAIEDAGEANPEAITEAIRAIEFDTLFPEPIQYSEYGELENQVQLYSTFSLDAPSYYPDGNYSLQESFRTDPLPALPPEA